MQEATGTFTGNTKRTVDARNKQVIQQSAIKRLISWQRCVLVLKDLSGIKMIADGI